MERWSVTMDQGFRRGFTTAEKTELWDRWQRGESLKAIGRAFGKPSSSIYFQVSPYGGIFRFAPESGLKSDIAPSPKCAKPGSGLCLLDHSSVRARRDAGISIPSN